MSNRKHGAPSRQKLIRRLLLHLSFSLAVLSASLGVGMWGYSHFEHMGWRDSFINSAMLMSGMGPVKTDLSDDGKVFAGVYALYAGLVVIAVTGLLLAPAVHHVMKQAHWEDHEQ
jgi:hypothetical protein